MSILQQLINYLSQPPDSMVYHIITLLALQATLGLAWWQARRRPDDRFARRLAWASGAVLLSRLLILLAIFATTDLIESVALLPPLERAVDTLAVAILVWALAPQPRNLPYLNNALLLIIIIVIAVLYFAFATEWRTLLEDSDVLEAYAASQQAVVWSILQMALLGIGAALVSFARESQWSARLAILAVLFIAQGLSLLFGGSYGPPNVEISFWSRLGNIIAFPMLAILAYRHNLLYLLPTSHLGRSTVSTLVESLAQSSNVSRSLQPDLTLIEALKMITAMMPVRFSAIARVSERRPQHYQVTTAVADQQNRPDQPPVETRTWALRREDWPSLAAALGKGHQTELLSDGPGARQLHELSKELDLGSPDALLIEPLVVDSAEIGLLLLAGGSSPGGWSVEEKTLVTALGKFLANALYNAQRYQLALAGHAPDFEREKAALAAELEQIAEQRDLAQEQTDELSDQLALARERLEGDHRKLRETTQALAMAVRRQTKVRRLEAELDSLREALAEAELALANAAAGEAGLSAEWVMRTVTRYSGELEEAHTRITDLEERLMMSEGYEMLEQAAMLAGRLRTPLTALGGYTDLLLEQEMGKISPHQESLLRRMRVNVDNMTLTVESLSTAARLGRFGQVGEAQLDVNEALEEAILAVSPKLQTNKLRVDISIEDGLPALQGANDGVQELFAEALNATCRASIPKGLIRIRAQLLSAGTAADAAASQSSYLRVSLADNSGNFSHALYTAAILEQGAVHAERDPSDACELAAILDKLSLMIASLGGRSWLDLTQERGSTLFLLLPLPGDGAVPGDASQ